MDKLGYTFYPKDFISDPDVMMMSSSDRGIYRDLIDLAYMSGNKIRYNLTQLAKYCNDSEEAVNRILILKGKKVGDWWEIPSCNKRIQKAKISRINGKKGGAKPKDNPKHNPELTQNSTQLVSQREREIETESEKRNGNERETVRSFILGNEIFIDQLRVSHAGKDFEKAFNDCYVFHMQSDRPPTEPSQWKQKFISWLTNVNRTTKERINEGKIQ